MIFKVIFGNKIHIIKSTDKQKFQQFLSTLPTVFKSLPNRYKLSYLDEEGDEITFEDQNDYNVLLGTSQRSVKIIIREDNQEFIKMTNQIRIDPLHQDIIEQQISEIKHDERKAPQNDSVMEVEDSVIEEKIKLLLPEIVSKIKAEISEELKEKSKISMKNQPIIVEEPQPNFKKPVKQEFVPQKPKHNGITCDSCNWRNIEGVRYKCSVCEDFDFCQNCQAYLEHPHPFLKIKNLKQTPVHIFAVINEEDSPPMEANRNRQNHYGHPFEAMVNRGCNFVRGAIGDANCDRFKNQYDSAMSEWKKCSEEWKKSWNNYQNCEVKPENKTEANSEAKMEPKVEEKPQNKVQEKPQTKVEEKSQSKPMKAGAEGEKESANYLVGVFGYPYEKCLRWAQIYPYMTKEELLNFCLTSPHFFN